MKTNTNTTNAAAVTAALLKLADTKAYMNADAYHALWRRGQRAKLSGDELAYLWSELTSRAKERKLGHIAGRKYTPGTGVTPPEEAMPALPPKPEKPAKQAKADKPAKADAPAKPAKQAKADKPAKAKSPTQKEVLANMLATLVAMDARLTALEKKLA